MGVDLCMWLRIGVSIVSLGLAMSANAASVKLGTDAGGLVFDPESVTIKAGETVTWTNNAGADCSPASTSCASPNKGCGIGCQTSW